MSAHAPANNRRLDAIFSVNAIPSAINPSTQEWNDIRPDVILAQEFKGQIRRWCAFMTEGVDALFPRCHRASYFPQSDLYVNRPHIRLTVNAFRRSADLGSVHFAAVSRPPQPFADLRCPLLANADIPLGSPR